MARLKAKTPLRAKTPLKGRKTLVRVVKPKVRKRTTLEQKTAQQLVKEADRWFSYYIRIRDSEKYPDGHWYGTCITCPREMVVYTADGKWTKGPQNGHYIGRGNHELRYSELNCNLQCAHCNAWLDKIEMIERYTKAIKLKYGDYTVEELRKAPFRGSSKKSELLAIIADSKTQLEWALQTA